MISNKSKKSHESEKNILTVLQSSSAICETFWRLRMSPKILNKVSQATLTTISFLFVVKQDTPMDDELEELGEKIAKNWKKLGRRLGISEPKLQEIHEAHDQLSEKGYYMLKYWKQEKGSAATYQALRDALQHKLVQRQDLAEQFCFIDGNYNLRGRGLPYERDGGFKGFNQGLRV